MKALCIAGALVYAAITPLAAQVRTSAPTEYIDDIGANGGTVAASGQRFTAWGSELLNFSFWASQTGGITLRAYIATFPYAFMSNPLPTPLFTSALFTTVPGTQKLTFETIGLSLTPGQTYFAYVIPESGGFTFLGTVCYFQLPACSQARTDYYANFGGDGLRWEIPFVDEKSPQPVAFEAAFATPEPGSLLLMATGLAGLGLAGFFRLRRARWKPGAGSPRGF